MAKKVIIIGAGLGGISAAISLAAEGFSVEVYEKNKYSEPKRDPIGNLKFLMEQHQLKQDDMTELGKQGSVSDILRGRRNLTVPQITALSKRFSISPNVFISGSE